MSRDRTIGLLFSHPFLDAPGPTAGLQVAPSGRLAVVRGERSLRQSLLMLLSTRPGERVNRPDYGCHLFRLAFAPADDTTAGLAIHYVARAVERWEPRVEIVSIDADVAGSHAALLEVRLDYRARSSRAEDSVAVAVPLASGGPS